MDPLRLVGDLVGLEGGDVRQRLLFYDLRLLLDGKRSTVAGFLAEIEVLFLLCIYELSDTAVQVLTDVSFWFENTIEALFILSDRLEVIIFLEQLLVDAQALLQVGGRFSLGPIRCLVADEVRLAVDRHRLEQPTHSEITY
jgi:hypothetical protein